MTLFGGRRLSLQLDATEAGTALGAIAWVLGALEIMKDRGHAEQDEEFHDLYEQLAPRLEALIAKVAGARMAAGDDPALQRGIEAAYGPLREAFETWIQMTAADTFSVALGQRLAETLDGGEAEGEGAAQPPPNGD